MNLNFHPDLFPQFKRHLENLPENACIGVRLKKAGCSGWEFMLEPTATPLPSDSVVEVNGIRFCIDRKTGIVLEPLYISTRMDGLQRRIEYMSPAIGNTCGCGSSNQIKQLEISS
jgi:iron-sulfur cluster assembly protein